MEKIYFYPHAYLRDRQLDVIRRWPSQYVQNPELALRSGAQVTCDQAVARIAIPRKWMQCIPLINLKTRPRFLSLDTVVFAWGAVIASGPFIVELDNPYALTGYNLRAMNLYRRVLLRMLESSRCRQVRCLSDACRQTVQNLFGPSLAEKSCVSYPSLGTPVKEFTIVSTKKLCRFLFVGTQFEIKGGMALLRAFRSVRSVEKHVRLDIVTHLPDECRHWVDECEGVYVHTARYSREQLWEAFFARSDVLVHPTYVETFGMVVLEAMAHGLAVVATDVYAMTEMVVHGETGFLLDPPLSIWDGVTPSQHYFQLRNIKRHIQECDMSQFEQNLAEVMRKFASDRSLLMAMRRAGFARYRERFASHAS